MKKFDIVIKTGEYTANTGETKGRYENAGEIHAGKEGSFYARINAVRMLGLCMMAIGKGDDSILASLYPPKEQVGQQQKPSGGLVNDFEDSIPF